MQDKKPRNENGLAHGLWKIHYKNGQLTYELMYKNGVSNGPITYYTVNGEVSYIGHYKNDEKIGFWCWYFYGKSMNFYAR